MIDGVYIRRDFFVKLITEQFFSVVFLIDEVEIFVGLEIFFVEIFFVEVDMLVVYFIVFGYVLWSNFQKGLWFV